MFCITIYFQSKQKEFLYYGLYNLFLLSYILLKTPFFKDIVYQFVWETSFHHYNWFSQNIYITFLVFFYMQFLDMKIHFPKMKRIFTHFLLVSLSFAFALFILDIFIPTQDTLRLFFIYIFIPFLLIITLFAFYFAYKTPKKLGVFIITGILFYNIFAYIAFYKSIMKTEPEPLIYFFIGILLESLVFMFGLGYKIKLIYNEKINAQKKIISEQIENQLLKERYGKELEIKLKDQAKELIRAQKKAEKEKLNLVKVGYEKELNHLHLASLQSQMNPHFIFNALNSIKVFLIENNKEKAVYYLNKFSKLIRKILESSRIESHSLEEELGIISLYLSIENIRFEDEIKYAIEKTTHFSLATIKVPPLFLQPFVENAIWHGLMLSSQKKKITIKVYEEKGILKLSLLDNGIGRKASLLMKQKKSFKKESVGLKMTEERLSFFNKKHGFDYSFEFIDLEDETGNALGTEVRFIFEQNS